MLERVYFYYNMNEVFFDMVRHYYDYTDDVETMKEIFPILVGAIDRENRRLRPAGCVLYESALNTWISDSHWYIDAQCTQVFANIAAALASAGGGWGNVVQFTTYMVHSQDIARFMAWRLREFPRMFPDGRYPPNTLLIVDRLVQEPFLVEVQTVAAL